MFTKRFPLGKAMALLLASSLALWPGSSLAHDASSWGGLFRSRDGGSTWFQASVGKVMGSALAVALDPNDTTRLLLGTDSGLLESRNGGLDWDLVAADVLIGPVLAVAFDSTGQTVLAATGSTLAISDDGVHWRPATLPVGAAPARSLVAGTAPGAFYLVGWQGLFRTENSGGTWSELHTGRSDPKVTRLVIDAQTPAQLMTVDVGDIWLSRDSGRRWELRSADLPAGQIQVAAFDPGRPNRLWAAGANQVFASDDAGSTWRRVGQPLPEADTEIRGMAVDARERAQGESTTLYAGFSVTPYDEAWNTAAAGGSPLSRLAASEAFGGAAFILMVGLAAGLALRWLALRSAPAMTRVYKP